MFPRTSRVFFALIFFTGLQPTLSATALPCCSALSLLLPNEVFYPESPNYVNTTTSYFSAFEDELTPSCVVRPTSKHDISLIIKTLKLLSELGKCQLAVKGGGHTAFAGSANINGGVTLDMQYFTGVNVSQDHSLTSIGAGERWGDVYRQLDPLGLSLSGGRVSKPGVAGLTLGGGISFFSTRKGFVCDNVVNYEIVLANGDIVNANATENSDLWLALKGGSNNFGIVTRFDMIIFQQGPFWGGFVFYAPSTFPQQLKALNDLATNPDYDVYVHAIVSYGYGLGAFAVTNTIYYTKGPSPNPPALQPFASIQPQFENTLRAAELLNFTDEQGAYTTDGNRQTFITATFKPTLDFLHTVWGIWNSSFDSVQSASGIQYGLIFQPIPPALTSKSAPLGGNSLGLDPADGPLMLVELAAVWGSAADDARVIKALRAFVDQVNQAAVKKGLDSRYIYLNYAYKGQDPISGYGPQNKARLQAVSRKYDPSGFFQNRVPGGFKLFT